MRAGGTARLAQAARTRVVDLPAAERAARADRDHAGVGAGIRPARPDGEHNRIVSFNHLLRTGTLSDSWHVFAVEWETDTIRWYVVLLGPVGRDGVMRGWRIP